ncbi:hypothetical protein [Thermobacillus sp.]|uniref:hypothetical protein n=1 Tax=Thermobacillus sp. TaxID=2108467 RepID=UPI00257BFC3B|nr:hypothetical protein [Thermobacillus sp.]
MEIRSDHLFGMALPDDRDRFLQLCESYAATGMVYANLLEAFADGMIRWMERSFREDGDRSGIGPDGMPELLGRAGWIGELNALLAILVAKHHRILHRLSERTMGPELARTMELATSTLWSSGNQWGVALCRLLRRLHLLMQSGACGDARVKWYGFASFVALQQLHELLIHARRWRVLCRALLPDMPDLSRPAALERELERLERAWLAARYCGKWERRANLRQIGLLQHWLAGLRDFRISRYAFVRRQIRYPRPWLNKMIRTGIPG